jgi:ABC-type nitrate/sulfonate/bicarbonate transport system permease component
LLIAITFMVFWRDIDMQRYALGAVIPLALLIAWEAVWNIDGMRLESLSRPSDVWRSFVGGMSDGSILRATGQTLEAALTGFALACAIGIVLGIVIGLLPRLERVVSPTIDALRPIPSVALIPLSLMIFGFSASMEAVVVAFACVWPVLLITIASVKGMEARLLEVSRVLELGVLERPFKVVIPAALSGIVVGLRLALAIALIVAITVEIVINPRGLGHEMMAAQQALQFDRMYACLLWVGAIGWAISEVSLAGIKLVPGLRLEAAGGVR